MIQCAVLCLASVILHVTNPEWTDFGTKFGQFSSLLHWCLKWTLSLWALCELNWTLNRWADRRWSFTVDKSGWDWKREVAVVTGGSGGIGAAIVKKLVSHGIRVAVLDVNPLSDVFTKDELALIRFYKCDITSPDNIHQAAEAIRSDLGHPSILINNAGIGNAWNILDITHERLQKLFNINLLSHWSTVQEFLPDMLAKKKGHILGIGSLSAYVTLAGAVDYSCAKAGVQAFYEGLTAELKHRYKCPQIQSSCINPNWTKSAITSHGAISGGLKKMGARLMETEDVAEVVVNQIISVRSGHIALGPSITTRFRSLPTWLQEVVRDDQSRAVVGTGSTGKG
ncbi:uncharacterized protein yc1106_09022 [Curvularia clavata]|uniref:Short-chain dehydrogenase/reductase 3 n=1 Tax=Curvularia clavata TaxID=95742 RepID=A0A9Q8ZJC1_CURCL|nr:uncharacterized protein yc1106_09022 [Curvularia clavata]